MNNLRPGMPECRYLLGNDNYIIDAIMYYGRRMALILSMERSYVFFYQKGFALILEDLKRSNGLFTIKGTNFLNIIYNLSVIL